MYIYRSADGAFTASKSGLMALSSAFFIIRIIADVASTCGNIASLNRSARCSGYTRNVWRPNVRVTAGKAANLVGERPIPSIARFRRGSISDARGGNKSRCARRKRHGRPEHPIMKTETSISILSDQKSRDPRVAKPSGKEQAIFAITPRAIESALWLSLYGFADTFRGCWS